MICVVVDTYSPVSVQKKEKGAIDVRQGVIEWKEKEAGRTKMQMME